MAESELAIAVDVLPLINKLPLLGKSEFCLCHAQPISTVGAKAAGYWCPVSKKKLRKQDVVDALSLGTLHATLPKAEAKKGKKDEPTASASEPSLTWFALRRIDLNSLNLGLLFGEV